MEMQRSTRKWSARLCAVFFALQVLIVAGCASVGGEFDARLVPSIEQHRTTRADIERMFGQPWRTGLENGQKTWTYAHYTRSLGDTLTRDLVIRFDAEGRVASYTFNSNYPEDRDL
jgi:hypothetical protein